MILLHVKSILPSFVRLDNTEISVTPQFDILSRVRLIRFAKGSILPLIGRPSLEPAYPSLPNVNSIKFTKLLSGVISVTGLHLMLSSVIPVSVDNGAIFVIWLLSNLSLLRFVRLLIGVISDITFFS